MALLKKHIWLPAIFVPLLILLALSIASGQEEQLVLSPPGASSTMQRSAVAFPHALHMEDFDCLLCHHDFKNGKNVLNEDSLVDGNPNIACSHCHNAHSKITLREAYHRQCIGCHRKERIAGKRTGPGLCGECHKKK